MSFFVYRRLIYIHYTRPILTTEYGLKYQATETTKIQKSKDYDGL